ARGGVARVVGVLGEGPPVAEALPAAAEGDCATVETELARAAERAFGLESATLFAPVEPVDLVLAVELVESVWPVVAPTLEPLVLWLDDVAWPVASTLEPVVL